LPRRQTYLQQVRGRSPVLLVDGGDIFFAGPSKKAPDAAQERRAFLTARTILRAYNYMGYQVVALGPADIQYGIDTLKNLVKEASFPVVCANLVNKKTGEPVFKSWVIIEESGVRFGVYGTILDSLNKSYTRRVLGEDYEILDALESTRKVVSELRPRCDVVIALSHLNKDDNYKIATSVEGIDAIVDPYCQYGNKAVWIMEGEYLAERGGVPILRIDGQGSRVGVFEMNFGASNKRITSYRGYDYPLEPQIFDHPDMAKIVKGRSLTVDFDARAVRLLDDRFLGYETCGGCHQAQYDFWKSTKHSTAYASLEKDSTELRHDCVECHTVAFGVSYVDPTKVGEFKNVQCESCHGINANHPENPKQFRLGAVKEGYCWGCHNETFTKKTFYYAEAKEKAACPKMLEN